MPGFNPKKSLDEYRPATDQKGASIWS